MLTATGVLFKIDKTTLFSSCSNTPPRVTRSSRDRWTSRRFTLKQYFHTIFQVQKGCHPYAMYIIPHGKRSFKNIYKLQSMRVTIIVICVRKIHAVANSDVVSDKIAKSTKYPRNYFGPSKCTTYAKATYAGSVLNLDICSTFSRSISVKTGVFFSNRTRLLLFLSLSFTAAFPGLTRTLCVYLYGFSTVNCPLHNVRYCADRH